MKLLSLFRRKPKKIPYIYLEWKHNGWGNAINVTNWEDGELNGHLQRIPELEDRIIFKMESGKLLETKIIKVRQCNDPRDMWFATMEPVNYIDSGDLDMRLKKQKNNEPKGVRFLI